MKINVDGTECDIVVKAGTGIYVIGEDIPGQNGIINEVNVPDLDGKGAIIQKNSKVNFTNTVGSPESPVNLLVLGEASLPPREYCNIKNIVSGTKSKTTWFDSNNYAFPTIYGSEAVDLEQNPELIQFMGAAAQYSTQNEAPE